MTKNKKRIIIILSVILFICLAYVGAWYYYYSCIYKKHIPENFSDYQEMSVGVSSGYRYISPPDEGYNTYYITEPKFGHFVCSIGGSSAVGMDDNRYTINENGDKEYEIYNMSGSDFHYSFGGRFLFNGKLNGFSFNVEPAVLNEKYAVSAHILLDRDGQLMNGDELSTDEYAIYEDAYPEILEFIENLKTMFYV